MVADLEPGQNVGPFTIEGIIGRGGMGVVYRARDPRLDRAVALKVVSPHLAASDDYRERFITEARAAAAVEHRGIIPIFEVGDADGVLYIAMRLVDGEDLGAYARRHRPMDFEQALRVLAPVGEALDAAAKRGLVHRDVKPSNILIADPASPTPEVLLSDFGLAKTQGAGGVTQTGQFVGSVDYVAPEQIATGVVDGRADQYALACVLFELLTGEPPYRREQPMQTLFAQVNDPVPSARGARSDLPGGVDEALAKALAKNPDQRYPSCAAMLNALAAAGGIGPVARESSTSLPRLEQPQGQAAEGAAGSFSGRGRVPLIVGAVVLALLAVAGGAIGLSQRGGDDAAPAVQALAGEATDAVTTEDTAAAEAERLAALQEAFDHRQAFLDAAGGAQAMAVKCDRVEGTRESVDCFLAPTWTAEHDALIGQAGEAGQALSASLGSLENGASSACTNAVEKWVSDSTKIKKSLRRHLRKWRQLGYPEQYYESEALSRSSEEYLRPLANERLSRQEVNRVRVMIDCQPPTGWVSGANDPEPSFEMLRLFWLANYGRRLQYVIESYCYATVGGGWYEGEASETEFKTCVARNAEPDVLEKSMQNLERAYARLVDSPAWDELSKKCRGVARSAVNIESEYIAFLIEKLRLSAGNASLDQINAFDEEAPYTGAKNTRLELAQNQIAACLTPKAERPA